jgi:uncharacterized membrane protein
MCASLNFKESIIIDRMKDKTSDIVAQFIRLCSYDIEKEEVVYQLQSSPYYPSLRAITGVLDHFVIEHIAAEIPRNAESIAQLPTFFMAHLFGDRFSLVVKKGDKFKITYDDGSSMLLNGDKLVEIWDGVVLVAEEGNLKKSIKLSSIKYLSISAAVFVAVITVILSNISFCSIAHFCLTLLGLVITFLIVKHEMGEGGRLVDAICSGSNERISCNDVLQSKGSKLFGRFGFGQIGFSYFMMLGVGRLISSLYGADTTSIVQLTLLALPFTIYSLLYQAFVVKKWCLLCLSVVLTLWLMGVAILFANKGEDIIRINLQCLGLLAFLFVLAFAYVDSWIESMRVKRDFSDIKVRTMRFKQKTSIYHSLASQSSKIDTHINSNEIVLGNTNSPTEVIIITSPLCGFCKEVHSMVNQMLHSKVNAQFRIRFNIKDQDVSSKGFQICRKLIDIYKKQGYEPCMLAMNDIYGSMSPSTWLQKYGLAGDEGSSTTLQAERRWCEHNQISFTPEILINGVAFPKEYDRQDLPMVLVAITEEQEDAVVHEMLDSNQS